MLVPVTALSDTNVDRPVGGDWPITVMVNDADGYLAAVAPIVTITRPDGTTATPTVVRLGSGAYRAVYEIAAAGRHVARAVAAGYGAAVFVAFAGDVTAADAMPAVADVDAYLAPHSYTVDELQRALDAEAAAQRTACFIPAEYPADLREALLRRIARNLAMRPLPLAVLRGDSEAGETNILPGSDPEIRRLEGPHRKITIA